ncbi:MAG: hypothetical protein JXA21_21955 [Anaerolineae bacterium]|nr:hypothetical protein [Anaerolineae bacterium]
MLKLWRSLLTLFGIYQVSCLTIVEPAGKALTSAYVTVEKLRDEFGNALPERFYQAFGQACQYQLTNHPVRARFLYSRLSESLQRHTSPALCEQVKLCIGRNVDLLP